jgi:hypothetical protein
LTTLDAVLNEEHGSIGFLRKYETDTTTLAVATGIEGCVRRKA